MSFGTEKNGQAKRNKKWVQKIERNISRDKANNRQLKKDGRQVIRFWSNDVMNDANKCVKKVMLEIENKLCQ